jgi:hypothetical protein
MSIRVMTLSEWAEGYFSVSEENRPALTGDGRHVIGELRRLEAIDRLLAEENLRTLVADYVRDLEPIATSHGLARYLPLAIRSQAKAQLLACYGPNSQPVAEEAGKPSRELESS